MIMFLQDDRHTANNDELLGGPDLRGGKVDPTHHHRPLVHPQIRTLHPTTSPWLVGLPPAAEGSPVSGFVSAHLPPHLRPRHKVLHMQKLWHHQSQVPSQLSQRWVEWRGGCWGVLCEPGGGSGQGGDWGLSLGLEFSSYQHSTQVDQREERSQTQEGRESKKS